MPPFQESPKCLGRILIFLQKRFPHIPVPSQGEELSTGKSRGTPWLAPPFQSPPNVSVHSRGTGFPCTASTFTPTIDSHNADTCDSPVGKPRGKASRESHISLYQGDGKPDTAATAREENGSACPHSRGGLTSLWRLQKYLKSM